MSTKLEKLLEILSDNLWHSSEEVAEILKIPMEKFQQIMEFLTEADLIQCNLTNQIKLNQNWKTLIINKKEDAEKIGEPQTYEKAVGTIVIPPQKSLMIQNTCITNLTDISLELEISIDKKIKEIIINKIK